MKDESLDLDSASSFFSFFCTSMYGALFPIWACEAVWNLVEFPSDL